MIQIYDFLNNNQIKKPLIDINEHFFERNYLKNGLSVANLMKSSESIQTYSYNCFKEA